MNDINELNSRNAVKKVKDLVAKIGVCMFCTKLVPVPFSTRPMATQKVDDDGVLWFFSDKHSAKNMELTLNSQVELLYSNESKSEFLCVYGHAEIIEDAELAKNLWSPAAKTWFAHGPDDPDLTIIKVTPEHGHYWDAMHRKMVALKKIVMAVVAGYKLDEEGVEGMLMC